MWAVKFLLHQKAKLINLCSCFECQNTNWLQCFAESQVLKTKVPAWHVHKSQLLVVYFSLILCSLLIFYLTKYHVLDGGVQIFPCKVQFLGERTFPGMFSDTLSWAVQKWPNRSRCRLGCWLKWAEGSMCYVRYTLAPPSKYDWTVHVWWPCKNGGTNRDAVWGMDSGGPKEPCITWGTSLLTPWGIF